MAKSEDSLEAVGLLAAELSDESSAVIARLACSSVSRASSMATSNPIYDDAALERLAACRTLLEQVTEHDLVEQRGNALAAYDAQLADLLVFRTRLELAKAERERDKLQPEALGTLIGGISAYVLGDSVKRRRDEKARASELGETPPPAA